MSECSASTIGIFVSRIAHMSAGVRIPGRFGTRKTFSNFHRRGGEMLGEKNRAADDCHSVRFPYQLSAHLRHSSIDSLQFPARAQVAAISIYYSFFCWQQVQRSADKSEIAKASKSLPSPSMARVKAIGESSAQIIFITKRR